MTITEVGFGLYGLCFGASNGDDEIIICKIEVRKIKLTERAEEAAKGSWKNLEKAGMNLGVLKPVNSLLVVVRSVNRGVGIKFVESEKNTLGATDSVEPVDNKSDATFSHLAPR